MTNTCKICQQSNITKGNFWNSFPELTSSTFVQSDLETPLGFSKYQQSMCYRRHQHRQKCDFCTPQISVPRGTYTIKLINLSQFLKRLHVFCVKQNSYTSLGLLAMMKCSICSYQLNMSNKILAVGSKLGTLVFLS